jgi:hypothetical protein
MPSLSSVRLAGTCDCSTSSMISAFSDAGYLTPRSPHPRSNFFEQAVLQGQISHDLFEGGGLTTKILHLAGRRGTRRVPPASRRLPASRNSLDQPSRRDSSEMFSSPRRPSSTMRIFSSTEYCRPSGAECPSAPVLPALGPARKHLISLKLSDDGQSRGEVRCKCFTLRLNSLLHHIKDPCVDKDVTTRTRPNDFAGRLTPGMASRDFTFRNRWRGLSPLPRE